MTVFLDANIPMYLVGAAHPNRERARAVLDELVIGRTRLVTDAEVYQEVLHRYAAIRRPEAIDPALRVLDGLVDEVFPITRSEIGTAAALVKGGAGARNAIHVAVMRAHGVTRILTFDHGFDHFGELSRLT